MDDSIALQFNRALDEYIASHYIFPPASHHEYDVVKEVYPQDSLEEESAYRITPEKSRRKRRAARRKTSPIEAVKEKTLQSIAEVFKVAPSVSPPDDEPFDIDDLLNAVKDLETFTEAMLRTIREKDLIEADVYNSVFMDRKLFNKIRNDRNYQPTKRTALLLSVALRLTVEETQTFIGKAGYSLTHTSKMDIVIEFFMLQGNYNVMDINEALYDRGLPLLNPHA